jgi:hypothetical protein
MRPSQLTAALNVVIDKKRPAFVWGPPGVGKSDVIKQLAEARGIEMRDVRLNLMDPTDIKGFPVPDTKTKSMTWLPADFLPRKGEGLLFLDEMNQAAPAVQAASYQLLLNRCIGDYKLPDGWAILAAGNRQSDRANAQRMPSALANRLVHLNYDVHLDDWCTWAMDHEIPHEVVSFLRFRPDLLAPAGAHLSGEQAFPTPRSWEFVSDLIKSTLSPDVELELFQGTIGNAAAGELKAFLQIHRELPSIDQVKMDPDGTPVSGSPAVNFAIAGALANAASANVFGRFMKYVDRLPMEFQVVFIRDAVRRTQGKGKDEVAKTKEFTAWAVKHGNVLV